MEIIGTYSKVIIHKKSVFKEIKLDTNFERTLFKYTTNNGNEFIKHTKMYIDKLRESGIKVPKVIEITKKSDNYYIVQEAIKGDTLEKCIIKQINNLCRESLPFEAEKIKDSVKYFRLLLLINKRNEERNPEIIIDNNKNNFLIDSAGEIVYVDVTPPLIVSKLLQINLDEIKDTKNKDTLRSYLNKKKQIIKIIYYWFKTLGFVDYLFSLEEKREIFATLISEVEEVYGVHVAAEVSIEIYKGEDFFSKNLLTYMRCEKENV